MDQSTRLKTYTTRINIPVQTFEIEITKLSKWLQEVHITILIQKRTETYAGFRKCITL